MDLYFAFIGTFAVGLLAYYLLRPRVLRILLNPSDSESFNTIVAIIHSKRWFIFGSTYVDHYSDLTIVDLSIPNVIFNQLFGLFLNLERDITVVEAK